ncbi:MULTISPECIES: hypothetical protein [unclassified Idiomarina]|uniref:hypothetical protein n=1 Tax=unclassified Idiomarina TaxID=2614829 RepID=UPI000C945D03|nr:MULTISPECIES: hypothetical protein [unclassified Idiomarina]MAD53976.1 hypothetical protein [Idiomarinaceae bacterium]MEC7644269.1 hypothetical protein [Pseudomonadota bacterium]NQZ03798.1 hypothetical protein [Idiomarina sp.]|tara:strand:- start:1908 stop:2471 length:564 start_codon:yes stop_codon:yes gene_type:complete
MKNRPKPSACKGHVLVESLIVAGLWVVLMISLADVLLPAVNTSETTLVEQRQRIFADPMDSEKLQRSSDYASAKVSHRLLGPLDKLVKNDLDVDNLVQTKQQTPLWTMAQLRNDWAAKDDAELRDRPAGWVLNRVLDMGWLNTVQDVIAILPFAREFSSESLIWGYIDDEIVPEEEETCSRIFQWLC